MTTRSSWKHGTGLPIRSSSLRNRRARPEPSDDPPPPEHDLIATGSPNPDATGYYDLAGTYDGEPYYARTDAAFHIWYFYFAAIGAHIYNLSPIPGDFSNESWFTFNMSAPNPLGTYDPNPDATGTILVAIP